MEKMLKLGPKEMKGEIWDEKGSTDILEILISHQQDSINSIQFTCNTDGEVFLAETHGEPTGMKFKTVTFDYSNNEYLTSISGEYDNGRLVSIVFGTNKKKYGPFGRTGSKSDESSYDDFCFEFGPRNCFGGFHGSVFNGCVHAIGVYVKQYKSYADDEDSIYHLLH
ncbi:putative jacalin-like lectin domain-containing protein [Helianthus debilis subsp. tardiflorus]